MADICGYCNDVTILKSRLDEISITRFDYCYECVCEKTKETVIYLAAKSLERMEALNAL